MAQAWNWLGTRTTLVHNAARLLKSEEPFVSDELTEALGEQGIEVITQADATAIRRLDGAVELEIDASDGSSTVRKAEQVVIAVGRRPNTDDVGVESVGLEPGTTLEVDDHMRALGMDWLYAVGDVNGRAQLTHMGKYQARVAGAHIAGKDAAVASVSATPRVVFTSPEIAAVGLTEQRATEDGIAVDTVTFDLGQVSAATVLGEGRSGTAKLVIDRDRHIVLGATFTGPQAGELVHSATIAIVGEVPLSRLWHAVPAFPTLSEVWLRLLESYRDRGWDPYG